MSKSEMEVQTCPDYRVRLFLSVDLAGSTAYKHNKEAEDDNPLAWVRAFEEFYRIFPETLEESYRLLAKGPKQLGGEEISKGCPRFWKRVGDEILFCSRVFSLSHLGLCIDAFINTLQEYSSKVEADNLSVKGNAWVASFPVPNVVFRLENEGEGDYLLDEESEQEVDAKPHLFDFLGKEIDAGFRIAKNSSPDELTVSPSLAFLLSHSVSLKGVTGFDRAMRLKEMQAFKGVAENDPYPVLVLDASQADSRRRLLKRLERKLLSIPEKADNDYLREYLQTYLKQHKIQLPRVPYFYGADNFSEPSFYKDFKIKFRDRAELNLSEDNAIKDSVIFDAEQYESKVKNTEKSDHKQKPEELLSYFLTALNGKSL